MGMTIGADLALRHGSLVDIDGNIIYCYTEGVGMTSTATEIALLADVLVSYTPPDSTIVIDWDRKAGYWGGGRSPEVAGLITMLVSFYGALAAKLLNCKVYYVTPALVRECLGLSSDVKKALVHYNVQELGIVPGNLPNDINGDNFDAWILAYTYECAKDKHR